MPQMLPFVLLMFVFSLLIPQVHNHYHTITKVKPVAMPVRIAVPAPPPKVVTHFATRHGRRHADRGRWRGGKRPVVDGTESWAVRGHSHTWLAHDAYDCNGWQLAQQKDMTIHDQPIERTLPGVTFLQTRTPLQQNVIFRPKKRLLHPRSRC